MGEGLGSAKNVGEHVESGDGALIGQVLSVTLDRSGRDHAD